MTKRKIPKFWNTPLCSPNTKDLQDAKTPTTIVQLISFLFMISLLVYFWTVDYGKPGIMEQVIDSENTTNPKKIIELYQYLFQSWPPWLANFIANFVLYGFISFFTSGLLAIGLNNVILTILPSEDVKKAKINKDEGERQTILDKNIHKSKAFENIASLKKRILHLIIETVLVVSFGIIITIIEVTPAAMVVYFLANFSSELFFNRSIPHFITNTRIIFLKNENGYWRFRENPSDMSMFLRMRWLWFRVIIKSLTITFLPITILLILYYKITPYDYLTATRVVDNK